MTAKLRQAVRDFVRLFESNQIPYALLGGLAARAHGIPRPTWDVDFTVAVNRSRLARLFEEAEQLGYTVPAAYRAGWVDQVGGIPFIKFGVAIDDRSVDIDVFLAESSYLETVIQRRIHAALDDLITVSVVTPEDLIVLKCLSNRPRDLIDIQDVLFMQGELDREYMRHWAERLGASQTLEESLRKFDESAGV